MMAKYHFIVAAISVFLFGFYWTPILIIPFMLGAVLVDFDHQIDFYLHRKRFTLSVTELSKELEGDAYFVLPLHSYEAIILTILALPLAPTLVGAFLIGLVIHMLFDAITNGYPSVRSLSLIYRVKQRRDRYC